MKENEEILKENKDIKIEEKKQNNIEVVQNVENHEEKTVKNEENSSKKFEEHMSKKTVVEKKEFNVTIEQLMEVGAQFGHKPSYTNPKMKKYIYTKMNGTEILNLDETIILFEKACKFLEENVAKGKKILWVGIRKNMKEQVEICAKRSGGYFINQRWVPGLLTNFETLQNNLQKREEIKEEIDNKNSIYTKKEKLLLERRFNNINLMYNGLTGIEKIPDIIVMLDTADQKIAVKEAQKMKIPIVGITDSNSELVDFSIPANDDSLRCIQFISETLTDFIVNGVKQKVKNQASQQAKMHSENTDNSKYTRFKKTNLFNKNDNNKKTFVKNNIFLNKEMFKKKILDKDFTQNKETVKEENKPKKEE